MRRLIVLLFLACAPFFVVDARTAEFDSNDSHLSPASFNLNRWEFGLDDGMAYPLRKVQFSHLISNSAVYLLIATEGVGDETAEGFVYPPVPGFSTVSGTMNAMNEAGMHVYYHYNPWLAVGVQGGYAFRREIRIDNRGIYVTTYRWLNLSYSANMMHVNVPVQVGPWWGRFRPHFQVAPGWYMVEERATIAFTDPDDPQVMPFYIVNKNTQFFGLDSAVGLDYRVSAVGSLGVDVHYHKIFGGRLDYVEPQLRFMVAF